MDLLILAILVILVIIIYQDPKRVVYLIAILEILFRLVHYIGDKLGNIEIDAIINKYVPGSVFSIIRGNSTGLLADILSWIVVGALVVFLFYMIKDFFGKHRL